MTWFDILKNEMRSINLPKFKVKPFNVNKPDEEDNDCKDRMFALQNKIQNTPLYDDNSIFDKVRDKGNRGGIEYYRIHKEFNPKRFGYYSETNGPDHFVSQFYLYPNTATNASIKDVKNKRHFKITVEETRYTMNKQAEKIPEEVYCRALDLIAQVPTVVNRGQSIGDSYRVGDWEIQYDHREDYGANNLNFNKLSNLQQYEWGGVSKMRRLHILSVKYPYEFHMRNRIDVTIDANGFMPVEEYGLDDAIKEILDHYKNIEIKWN